jgi:bile acid:Na+ symporter, BASS family
LSAVPGGVQQAARHRAFELVGGRQTPDETKVQYVRRHGPSTIQMLIYRHSGFLRVPACGFKAGKKAVATSPSQEETAMEILKELIPLMLQTGLFLSVLGIGLNASIEDATYVLKQPKLLLRSLAAIVVIVPAFAALMVAALPLRQVVEVGIVLMAVSPLPPLVSGKEIKLGGRKSYAYGMLVAVSVLSIVIVPVTVAILSTVFEAHASIAPNAVAGMILSSVTLPLTVGMVLRRISPQRAERAAPIIEKIAPIVLVVGALPVLVTVLPAMANLIGDGTIVVIEAVVAVGLLAGHMLGGPDPRDRAALAIASATRHPSMALLIAGANSTEPGVKAAILLFVIVGTLTAIPYKIWYKRHNPVHQQ